ncbi:hypothetical protein NECAME_19366, partial [Necator americanus]
GRNAKIKDDPHIFKRSEQFTNSHLAKKYGKILERKTKEQKNHKDSMQRIEERDDFTKTKEEDLLLAVMIA